MAPVETRSSSLVSVKVQMSDLARNSDASAHLERIPLQFHVDSQIFASAAGIIAQLKTGLMMWRLSTNYRSDY
jgi:hypothetical protein